VLILAYTIRTEEITANWIAKCCDENSVIQAVPETRKLAFKVFYKPSLYVVVLKITIIIDQPSTFNYK